MYKCPKCGNTKYFKIWSWAYVEQDYDQEKDDWSATNEYGDSHTDCVICAECNTVVIEKTYELKEILSEI